MTELVDDGAFGLLVCRLLVVLLFGCFTVSTSTRREQEQEASSDTRHDGRKPGNRGQQKVFKASQCPKHWPQEELKATVTPEYLSVLIINMLVQLR